MIYWLIVLFIVCLLLYVYYKHFRKPKLGTFTMVTGGVKSGKSTSSVACSVRDFHRRCRRTKIKNYFRKCFNKPLLDMPLYYCNVPIVTKYGCVPITKGLLLRKERFRYGSVIYFQEASFLAGSTDYGVESVDDAIKLLCKLIGHETKGGSLYVDTQAVCDLHNAFRRSCSMELYIFQTYKIPILPFLIIWYKQLYYNEDGVMVNVNVGNADDDLRKMLVSSKVWKRFDCYCYSVMTDDLPVNENVINFTFADCLKCDNILRLKDIIKEDNLKKTNYDKKNRGGFKWLE